MKTIVISKNEYSFADTKTGELIEGAKIYYLLDNGLEPVVLSVNGRSGNMNLLEEIKEVPGVYDLTLKSDVRKGQIVQSVVKANFVKPIDIMAMMK